MMSSSPATGSSQSQGGATAPSSQTAGRPEQGDTKQKMTGTQAGQGAKSKPAGQGLSSAQLRKHARAHVLIEQQAPDVHAKLPQVKDVTKDLSQEEQQKLAQAIRPAGYTLQQYAREHRIITANPQLTSRLTQLEQQVKSQQAGGASGAASTTGAAASKSPSSTGASVASSPAAGGGASATTSPGSASGTGMTTGGGSAGGSSGAPLGAASPTTGGVPQSQGAQPTQSPK
jgi:hypothetical protein